MAHAAIPEAADIAAKTHERSRCLSEILLIAVAPRKPHINAKILDKKKNMFTIFNPPF
jgi:hypothetical protein